jgi:N-glycosylase/DNA lyase
MTQPSAQPPAWDLPQISLSLTSHGIDLDATLSSGQAFSWNRTADGRWRGWIDGRPCLVWLQGDALRAVGAGITPETVRRYFGFDLPLREIFASFPSDPWLERARGFAPGLRVLRQDPWETLCNFICSSLKQIVQIQQINHELRRTLGQAIEPDLYTFPSPSRLALATELQLRDCRLGFRARHLFVAARQIAHGEISLEKVEEMPTAEARETLMRIRGVGEKVANCVLLFAYGRLEAFPIDVWVERVLREVYFKGSKRVKLSRMRDFSRTHFGPNGGYAQQFLFHWIRKDRHALPRKIKTAAGGKRSEPPATNPKSAP